LSATQQGSMRPPPPLFARDHRRPRRSLGGKPFSFRTLTVVRLRTPGHVLAFHELRALSPTGRFHRLGISVTTLLGSPIFLGSRPSALGEDESVTISCETSSLVRGPDRGRLKSQRCGLTCDSARHASGSDRNVFETEGAEGNPEPKTSSWPPGNLKTKRRTRVC